jgi:branched-chain amino acid transport system ATP-binding protein
MISSNPREEVLQVRGLNAWYGESHVLHGMNLDIRQGECLALLGRNGSGRTTTLRAIMGLTVRREGSIRVYANDVTQWASHRVARLGVGYCPEERGIFASLTCEENLLLPPDLAPDGMSLGGIYEMFPNLFERKNSPGTRLSGGEQQMLALARILRSGARLLLLDEISEGLAPVIVQHLAKVIHQLKSLGYTIVLVEQNFHFVAALADRMLVVEHGQIVLQVEADKLEEHRSELEQLLGV